MKSNDVSGVQGFVEVILLCWVYVSENYGSRWSQQWMSSA